MKRSSVWCLVLGLVACGPLPTEDDAGLPDGGAIDAGAIDAGEIDAGLPDAGEVDAGEVDAGLPDAGPPDAGLPDAGLQDAGPPATNCPVPTGSLPPFTIRVMAANLTTTMGGSGQPTYDPGHGARIMQGVQPDIVAIQEFNYGNTTASSIRSFVDDTFGSDFSYSRPNTASQNIPNGIISRWPILATGEWNDANVSDREFAWAHIDLPGPNDLWVVSVHLLTSSASNRNSEATQLISYLNANVPRYDYVIIGGDLNTNSRTEAAFNTFSSRFVVSAPQPVDNEGNGGTNAGRSKPYDNVLASPCLSAIQTPTIIGSVTFDAGAVIDTRVFMPLADLAPAQGTDSSAPSMQHMGVVKDFLISP